MAILVPIATWCEQRMIFSSEDLDGVDLSQLQPNCLLASGPSHFGVAGCAQYNISGLALSPALRFFVEQSPINMDNPPKRGSFRFKRLVQEIQSLREALCAKDAEIHGLREALSMREAQMAMMQIASNNTMLFTRDRENTISELKAQISALIDNQADSRARESDLQEKIGSLQHDTVALEKVVDKLKESFLTSKARMHAAAEALQTEFDSIRSSLAATHCNLTAKCDLFCEAAAHAVAHRDSKTRELAVELCKLQDEARARKLCLNMAESEADLLKGNLKNAMLENAKLKSKMGENDEKFKRDLDERNEELAKVHDTVRERDAQLQALAKEMQILHQMSKMREFGLDVTLWLRANMNKESTQTQNLALRIVELEGLYETLQFEYNTICTAFNHIQKVSSGEDIKVNWTALYEHVRQGLELMNQSHKTNIDAIKQFISDTNSQNKNALAQIEKTLQSHKGGGTLRELNDKLIEEIKKSKLKPAAQ